MLPQILRAVPPMITSKLCTCSCSITQAQKKALPPILTEKLQACMSVIGQIETEIDNLENFGDATSNRLSEIKKRFSRVKSHVNQIKTS